MKWFKQEKIEKRVYLPGTKVEFVADGAIHEGEIFGLPVPGVSVYHYNIRNAHNKAYLIPEFSIQPKERSDV